MENIEAFNRAWKSVERAHDETNAFDHGGMASGDIMAAIRRALMEEFTGAAARKAKQ